MAAAAQLRFSPLPSNSSHLAGNRLHFLSDSSVPPSSLSFGSPFSPSFPLLRSLPSNPNPNFSSEIPISGGDFGGGFNNGGSSGGGGSGGDGQNSDDRSPSDPIGPIGLFLKGWRSRVSADPQFPFKVLMEEIVGVSACVLGDMACRPNFGLNELDFVFSTLVVGSILNFVLMYLLAPTSIAASSSIASSLPSHMFEPGPFSLISRLSTFVFKGATFAAVGFGAGLAGTAISNGLIKLRKKMDPEFETPNKPPPTLLNALTWAAHMGLSSNLRYQTLNGVEFLMARVFPPAGFKVSVVVLRCLNNVLGGVSFVVLARLTGSQKSGVEETKKVVVGEEKESLVEGRESAVSREVDDDQSSK